MMAQRLCLMAAVASCLLLGGCTIMGFVLSQSLRDDNQSARALDGGQLRELAAGNRLRGEPFDGRKFGGRLVGFLADDENSYAARFREWRAALPAPQLGERVQIRGQEVAEGFFDGFDFDGIWLRGQDRAIGLYEVEELRSLDSVASLSGDFLRTEALNGELPYRSRIELDRDGQRGSLRTDEIAKISVYRRAAWGWTPVAVGLIADTIAISALVNGDS
jgi:hypothetical protein